MTETDIAPTTKRAGLWNFLVRWQEYAGWGPLCVALALLGWIFFGALDRSAAADTLAIGAVLPWKLAYAMAALGVTHLARRRWRRKLTLLEQLELWNDLRASRPGAIIIYFGDLVFTLCVLRWLLSFFSLPG